MKVVIFRRSDLEKSWAEVAIQQGRRTFVVERLDEQSQSHFDPHCSGYSGESVHDALIEPSAQIRFSVYRFSVTNPWPEVRDDGTLGPETDGSTERSLDEIRCTFAEAGAAPVCTKKTVAKATGVYATPVADGPAPLPWK